MNWSAIFNWSALGSISETIGAIAVVASLIYLAAQIKQNSNAVRATIEQESAKLINQTMMSIGSSEELSLLYLQATEDFSALKSAEKARMFMILTGIFRAFEVLYRQQETGHVSQEIWSGYEHFIKAVVQTDLFENWWAVRSDTFYSGFRDHVNQLDLSDAPVRHMAILR